MGIDVLLICLVDPGCVTVQVSGLEVWGFGGLVFVRGHFRFGIL